MTLYSSGILNKRHSLQKMPKEVGDDKIELLENSEKIEKTEAEKDKVDSEEESVESATSILGDIIKRSKEKVDQDSAPEPVAQDDPAIQEFQEAMGVLGNVSLEAQEDPIFQKMKGEYEKIHGLFVLSRRNEKSLMKKCRELTQELNSNASKVLAALKLSQNDRNTISSLKKETKKAWTVVESLNEREDRSKDVISSLKVEVESLKSALNEAGVTATMSPQTSVGFGRNRLLELQLEQETAIRHLKSVI